MPLADKNALPQVKELKQRIENIAKIGYAFGHQDTTSYGIGWRNDGIAYRSDVNDVAGDFPLVYGFDLGQIEHNRAKNLDDVPFDDMRTLIEKAHHDGGIITISWHADNPVSNKDSWNNTIAVKHILEGGKSHETYKMWLGYLADFLGSVKDEQGALIPIAFRPFHEMNGSWFWWGNPHCSPVEYKELWKQTLHILSNELGVNNLLYIYSPNLINSSEEFLLNYPGDAYVDMLGIDMYQHGLTSSFKNELKTNLSVLQSIGLEKNKPFALTEVGLEKVSKSDWWNAVLDQELVNSGISWVLLWRNHSTKHYYVPYPDQKSALDFVQFKNKEHVLFLKDFKNS